ncbi:MAG: RbsD/FucU family protein [Treponema sp.]|nr:RbsD/FucU family protein [Treponema sp.]
MFTCDCINPEIMKVLAYCGHGSKILIADGNYPVAEKSGDAKKVYLGLCKDIPKVTDVLKALKSVINIEKAEVMVPGDSGKKSEEPKGTEVIDKYLSPDKQPEIFKDFKEITGLELYAWGRWSFYDAASDNVVLAISTGESRTFANILLTVGCA